MSTIPVQIPVQVRTLMHTETDSYKADKLLERALSCDAVKELWERAAKAPYYGKSGPFRVEFTDDAEFGAYIKLGERIIRIKKNLDEDDALASFVFECTNGCSGQRFEKVDKSFDEGKVECEDYAKEKERIEHDGTFVAHDTIARGVKEKQLNEKTQNYAYYIYSGYESFEKWWEKDKYNKHTDFYRKQWLKTRAWQKYDEAWKAASTKLSFDQWLEANKSTPTLKFYWEGMKAIEDREKIRSGNNNSTSSVDNSKREKNLLEKVRSSKVLNELFDKVSKTYAAEKGKELSIKFVDDIICPFGARVLHEDHQIEIKNSATDDEALSFLIWALINIESKCAFDKIEKAAEEGKISCEEYTKELCKLDFASSLRHHQIMEDAGKDEKKFLTPDMDIYNYNSTINFDDWWDWNTLSDHADFYRQRYLQNMAWGQYMEVQKKTNTTISFEKWLELNKSSSSTNSYSTEFYFAGMKAIKERQDPCSLQKSNSTPAEKRVERLLQRSLSCKAIKELYDEASKKLYSRNKEKLKVAFDSEMSTQNSVRPTGTHISLKATLSNDEALHFFVLGLIRLISLPNYYEILDEMEEGEISCEEFTKEMCRFEFYDSREHHKIIRQAIEEKGWSTTLDKFSSNANMSFNDWWPLNRNNSKYINKYKAQWEKHELDQQSLKRGIIKTCLKVMGCFTLLTSLWLSFQSTTIKRTEGGGLFIHLNLQDNPLFSSFFT